MRILGLVVTASFACSGHDAAQSPPPAPQPVAPPVAAVPDAAPPAPPAPSIPATDLLSAVPADTPFVVAAVDPVPAAIWQRMRTELDPAAIKAAAEQRLASSLDPIAQLRYAVWIELAGALATSGGITGLGIAAQPRFVVYGAGAVPVLRLELGDAAAAERTIDRIAKRTGAVRQGTTWRLEAGGRAVVIAIANRVLAVAGGSRDSVVALAPHLGDAAAQPITEAAVRDLAKQHGLATSGAGWFDPARLAAVLAAPGLVPELDELSPKCRAETLAVVADLPRVALGWRELSSTRWALVASLAVDPATAATYGKEVAALPALPAELAGHPLFAGSLVAPDRTTSPWLAKAEHLEVTCGEDAKPFHLPAPWNTLKAGAVVVYEGAWHGLLPSGVDGYAGVSGDAGAVIKALAAYLPALAKQPPADGGPFVNVMQPGFMAYVPALALARRGAQVLLATGSAGKAHAGELVPRAGAPIFRIFADVARIREHARASDAKAKLEDEEVYRGEEPFAAIAGLDAALANLVGTIDVTIGAAADRLEVAIAGTFAPPHARAPAPPADPRFAVRDQCRTILRHALGATRPALAKLGVTTDLDGIAVTYTTSIQADGAIGSCAKLTAKERACLLAAPDVLAAAATCAPGTDNFHASRLELPPLFSFFGPRPLDARMHPKVDGNALRGKLAGTWVGPNETWTIDAGGHATIKPHDGEVRRGKLDLGVAGKVDLVGDDGTETMSFVQLAPDRFLAGMVETAVITAEDRFIAPFDRGFLVREPTGCTIVTEQGQLLAAQCTPGVHTLEVAYGKGQTEKYWFVGTTVIDHDPKRDAFVRH